MRVLVAILLGICTCQEIQADPCRGSKDLAWQKLESMRPKEPEDLARALESFRSNCGLPLNFWAGPKADEDKTVPHPCSGVMLEFVKGIPSPLDPILQPERVFEFNPSGEVINEWWVPVDSVVFEISGDELLIPMEVGREADTSRVYLAIRPQGVIGVTAFHEAPARDLIECPRFQDLPASDSRWCWEMVDKRSGRARRIAYDGPCT